MVVVGAAVVVDVDVVDVDVVVVVFVQLTEIFFVVYAPTPSLNITKYVWFVNPV